MRLFILLLASRAGRFCLIILCAVAAPAALAGDFHETAGPIGTAATAVTSTSPADFALYRDKISYHFDESQSDILYSLSRFTEDCQVDLISDPANRRSFQIKFSRDHQELITLTGHPHSVFQAIDHVLYFADYNESSDGGKILAFDLRSGKKLWQTNLRGVGGVLHSAYMNRINLCFPDGAVSVTGHESYGDYTEILDRKTWQTIAYKIFRTGYQ